MDLKFLKICLPGLLTTSILFLALRVAAFQQNDFVTLVDSAVAAMKQYDLARAEVLLSEAKLHLKDGSPDSLWFLYHHHNGVLNFDVGNLDAAEEHASKSLAIGTGMADNNMILNAYSSLANIYTKKGKYHEALRQQRLALANTDAHDSLTYYSILNNMSMSYQHLLKADSALYVMIEAKKFFARNGNMNSYALLETNIGELYRKELNEPYQAIRHFRKAIAINKELGARAGLARDYYNYALAMQDIDLMDSARHYLNLAISIKQQHGEQGGQAQSYYALGLLETKLGNYTEALIALEQAMKISEENGIAPGVYHTSMVLADVYQGLGKYKLALDQLMRAAELARTERWIDEEASSWNGMYLLQKAFGRWEDALLSLENYTGLIDSIQSMKASSSLNELRLQYDTDIAEAENEMLIAEKELNTRIIVLQQWGMILMIIGMIAMLVVGYFMFRLLKQRNEALKAEYAMRLALEEQLIVVREQQKQLEAANEFKKRIISVIGHDLRVPLNGIIGVLTMAKSAMDKAGVPPAIFERLEREAASNLKTLQNLVLWSRKEMQSLQPVVVTLQAGELIREVVDMHSLSIQQKDLDVKVNAGTLVADPNQFRSIVTNLLSNAIKFSSKGDTILLAIEENEHAFILSVLDEGTGVAPDLMDSLSGLNALKSIQGTEGEKGTGLGLLLVKEFAEAHGGKFSLSNRPTGGTCAEVVFPKAFEVATA